MFCTSFENNSYIIFIVTRFKAFRCFSFSFLEGFKTHHSFPPRNSLVKIFKYFSKSWGPGRVSNGILICAFTAVRSFLQIETFELAHLFIVYFRFHLSLFCLFMCIYYYPSTYFRETDFARTLLSSLISIFYRIDLTNFTLFVRFIGIKILPRCVSLHLCMIHPRVLEFIFLFALKMKIFMFA